MSENQIKVERAIFYSRFSTFLFYLFKVPTCMTCSQLILENERKKKEAVYHFIPIFLLQNVGYGVHAWNNRLFLSSSAFQHCLHSLRGLGLSLLQNQMSLHVLKKNILPSDETITSIWNGCRDGDSLTNDPW